MAGLDREETLLAKMTLRVEVHPDSGPKETEVDDLQHSTSPAPPASPSAATPSDDGPSDRVPEHEGEHEGGALMAAGQDNLQDNLQGNPQGNPEDLDENLHGVNHPAVGAVFQGLEYSSEAGGMTLRLRFCGLVPGFEYKLEILELSRVGLDTRAVYVKQTHAERLACPQHCCCTTTALHILDHLLPDFTENEAAFRFDITLIDAHAGVSGIFSISY